MKSAVRIVFLRRSYCHLAQEVLSWISFVTLTSSKHLKKISYLNFNIFYLKIKFYSPYVVIVISHFYHGWHKGWTGFTSSSCSLHKVQLRDQIDSKRPTHQEHQEKWVSPLTAEMHGEMHEDFIWVETPHLRRQHCTIVSYIHLHLFLWGLRLSSHLWVTL